MQSLLRIYSLLAKEAVIFGKNGLDGQLSILRLRGGTEVPNHYLLPLTSFW